MEGPSARPSDARERENNAGNSADAGLLLKQQQQAARLAWCQQRLMVEVTDTPPAGTAAPPPVSCPSRFQQSPSRRGNAAFDPFAAPAVDDEQPGCTPVCAQLAAQPPAPPAVSRKALASSPVLPAPPAALFPADRVQSCPPERVGRRGTRPLVRIRVKRSLNGAVAAAASGGGAMARRSLDAAMPAAPQLAGCSRKRIEADLLSPLLPRKSSRTLLEDQHAADMLARLQLAPQAGASSTSSRAFSLVQWAAPMQVGPSAGPPA